MSYHDQANKINEDLQNLFNSVPVEQFNNRQREEILNIILRIGQVVKFRCRNNSAYDNFMSIAFKEIANVQRVNVEGTDWKTLRATIKEGEV